jgi:hypothetical protein
VNLLSARDADLGRRFDRRSLCRLNHRASWPKLKANVESLQEIGQEIGQLKSAS